VPKKEESLDLGWYEELAKSVFFASLREDLLVVLAVCTVLAPVVG